MGWPASNSISLRRFLGQAVDEGQVPSVKQLAISIEMAGLKSDGAPGKV
jgi:hypothetical protein